MNTNTRKPCEVGDTIVISELGSTWYMFGEVCQNKHCMDDVYVKWENGIESMPIPRNSNKYSDYWKNLGKLSEKDKLALMLKYR